jgi:hypothetical protein
MSVDTTSGEIGIPRRRDAHERAPTPAASATWANEATSGASQLPLADAPSGAKRANDAILESLYEERFQLLSSEAGEADPRQLANVEAAIDYWEGLDASPPAQGDAERLQQITNQLMAIHAKLERSR